MKENYLNLLVSISKRPGMYVVNPTIYKISILLMGYNIAKKDTIENIPIDWQRWIEYKYKIFHPAWHWSRILLHYLENDQNAILALPNLYKEYINEGSPTSKELEKLCRDKLIKLYGQDFYAPTTTKTSEFY